MEREVKSFYVWSLHAYRCLLHHIGFSFSRLFCKASADICIIHLAAWCSRGKERKMLIEILDGAAAGAEADVYEACRVLTNNLTTSTSRFSFSSLAGSYIFKCSSSSWWISQIGNLGDRTYIKLVLTVRMGRWWLKKTCCNILFFYFSAPVKWSHPATLIPWGGLTRWFPLWHLSF